MSAFLKRIWFPAAVVCFLAFQTVGMDIRRNSGDPGFGFIEAGRQGKPDTVHYKNQFIRSGNGPSVEDTSSFYLKEIDTVRHLTARDTIVPPDSLREIDPFRYKYYVALIDSLTHKQTRDSLKAAGDSLIWPRIDSIYYRDSAIRKKAEHEAWYKSLSKEERKKYDYSVKEKQKKHLADSLLAVKDSLKSIKDSIAEYTPRILSTFAIPDSMQYKRIIRWTRERDFHKMTIREPDTNYNYRFHDYPIYRNDVNATWLGVAGAPAQYYDFFKRESQNGVSFYDPYEPWAFSPGTAPMYNTKTPYTELAYYGTLFAKSQKESDNLHIMTTQNLFPEFNFTLEYDRFGGNGIMEHEKVVNKNFSATTNYLGKRYLLHAGYLYNMVSRNENGGTTDNKMVSDTTLDAREYPILLTTASTALKKHSVFVDQQYRIPFTFLKRMQEKRAVNNFKDSILVSGDTSAVMKLDELMAAYRIKLEEADTTGDEDITNAFIGHSTEYSVFRKIYTDQLSASDQAAREFFNNAFFYDPTNSRDSMRTMKLENRLFIKLQPWSSEGIVSKLNGGIGNRLMSFYTFDPTFLKGRSNVRWNSVFAYAGVEGQLKNVIRWDASGDYTFLGDEQNDLSLKANARLDIHPFRGDRSAPVSLKVHFETSLEEPDFHYQHFTSNHYKWDNSFGKVSLSKVQGEIDVPKWKLGLSAGYALLDKNIYFDSTGVVRQNDTPMSVLGATLSKNFALGPVHLDNRILFQLSSNQGVVPLPRLAANSRVYLQFDVTKNVMQMQLGADVWYNTKFYSPGWNPVFGAFYNQRQEKYNNGPVIDAFLNMQWKRACIFVKYENAGQGWPMAKADYFSAHHYIRTQRAIKFGIYWPFYKQASQNKTVNASGGLSSGGSGERGGGGGMGGFGGFGGGMGGFGGGL